MMHAIQLPRSLVMQAIIDQGVTDRDYYDRSPYYAVGYMFTLVVSSFLHVSKSLLLVNRIIMLPYHHIMLNC